MAGLAGDLASLVLAYQQIIPSPSDLRSTPRRGSDIIFGTQISKRRVFMNRRSFCVTVLALLCGTSLALAIGIPGLKSLSRRSRSERRSAVSILLSEP